MMNTHDMKKRDPATACHFRFGWPVGMCLRFRLDAPLMDEYAYLSGARVMITQLATRHFMARPSSQYVYVFCVRDESDRTGRVQPEHLEIDPGQDDVTRNLNQAIVDLLKDSWFRPRKIPHGDEA